MNSSRAATATRENKILNSFWVLYTITWQDNGSVTPTSMHNQLFALGLNYGSWHHSASNIPDYLRASLHFSDCAPRLPEEFRHIAK